MENLNADPVALSNKGLLAILQENLNSLFKPATLSGNPITINNAKKDSISSLIVNGLTTQASGTPSPTNILPIIGVGYDTKLVLDGVTNGLKFTGTNTTTVVYFYMTVAKSASNIAYSSHFKSEQNNVAGNCYIAGSTLSTLFCVLPDQTITTVDAANAWLAAQKTAGTPVTFWYNSASYKMSTSWYIPSVVNNRAYDVTTTAQLFVGDTADEVSGTITRVLKLYSFTGTESFFRADGWNQYTYSFTVADIKQIADYVTVANIVCDRLPDAAPVAIANGTIGIGVGTGNGVFINFGNYSTSAELQSYLSAQYAAGTPVQILYQLSSPASESLSGNTIQNDAGAVTINGGNTMNVTIDQFSAGGGREFLSNLFRRHNHRLAVMPA